MVILQDHYYYHRY